MLLQLITSIMGQLLHIPQYQAKSVHRRCSVHQLKIIITMCDWILENGSKPHIFISVYLSLQHEKY